MLLKHTSSTRSARMSGTRRVVSGVCFFLGAGPELAIRPTLPQFVFSGTCYNVHVWHDPGASVGRGGVGSCFEKVTSAVLSRYRAMYTICRDKTTARIVPDEDSCRTMGVHVL